MIKYLGRRPAGDKYPGAYNVFVSYETNYAGTEGEAVAEIFLDADKYETYFAGLKFGSQLDLNVTSHIVKAEKRVRFSLSL